MRKLVIQRKLICLMLIISVTTCNASPIYSMPRDGNVMAAQPAQGPPGVVLTAIPEYGASFPRDEIAGKVINVAPVNYKDYKVIVMIFLEGLGFYSKPYCNSLLTPINSDGSFAMRTVTGGVDWAATQFVVYLVSSDFPAYCHLGGDDLSYFDRGAVAKVAVYRDNPAAKTIRWSGQEFLVKNLPVPVDPGRNIFTSDNVWVDNNGWLHLRLKKGADGIWRGAEIVSKNIYGRGRYTFTVVTPADRLPKDAVLGLFIYGRDPSNSHREVDVEIGRFGDANAKNTQYVVQPYQALNHLHRFDSPAGQGTIHSFNLEKDRVRFLSTTINGAPVQEWTYASAVSLLVDEQVRINLWNLNSASNDPETEVVLSKFEFTPEPGTVTCLSAADYANQWGLSPESLVSVFASGGLATTTLAATSPAVPASLGGTTVKIRDHAGVERLAPLLFVSPMQVNLLIPAETSTGLADVIVSSGDGIVSTGAINVGRVNPGIFTADATGQGVPAAVALRVRADGSQSYEPVGRYDPERKQFVEVPIDLGSPSDKVYLVLFGTGIRNRHATSTVKATIGGIVANVEFAGSQGSFVGLDQVNLLIPRTLAGRGSSPVLLTVDGQIANEAKVSIR